MLRALKCPVSITATTPYFANHVILIGEIIKQRFLFLTWFLTYIIGPKIEYYLFAVAVQPDLNVPDLKKNFQRIYWSFFFSLVSVFQILNLRFGFYLCLSLQSIKPLILIYLKTVRLKRFNNQMYKHSQSILTHRWERER